VSPDLRADVPITNLLARSQRSIRERKPDAIIDNTKILRGFGHAIRRQPLRQVRIVPLRVKHERRTHHHSAAPIEPLLLLARSRQPTWIHQRDLPLKLDAAAITLLQFRPSSLRPETPGRNNIEIISDSNNHIRTLKRPKNLQGQKSNEREPPIVESLNP